MTHTRHRAYEARRHRADEHGGTKSKTAAKAAQQKAPAQVSEFATKAATATAFEIQSRQLANERAERQEVKSFAKQMIDDHTKAGRSGWSLRSKYFPNLTPHAGNALWVESR